MGRSLYGGGVLLFWLALGRLALLLWGRVVLGIVALAVLGIGVAEIAARAGGTTERAVRRVGVNPPCIELVTQSLSSRLVER